MSETVCYTLDPSNPPPLTDEQKAELKALAEMPDEEIDYSDIPPLDEKFWKNAVLNPLFHPTKTRATVCLDSDILAGLRPAPSDASHLAVDNT